LQDLLKRLRLDFLFIDTHPGVNEETLLSIAVSDVLILIVRPDQQDFQGTGVAVELARKLDVPQMFVLINKVPPGMDTVALKAQVEAMYRTEVAAILPLSNEMVRNASSDIFANRYPDHPLSSELAMVARRIAGGSAETMLLPQNALSTGALPQSALPPSALPPNKLPPKAAT
jgi:MinD-like ATPase involved in chromosome partitioning or flagellar assembly